MDPTETLHQLIALCDDIEHDKNATEREELIAEKFDALHNWLSNGGFLPNEWARKR